MSRVRLFLLVFLVSVAFSPSALAQGLADIVGRVTDTSGAVLPGANVTAQNAGTSISQNTITSETGDYLFTALPIGTYTVKIELQGFQTQSTRVSLSAGDRARVDGKLAVGSLSETVQVTGEAPLLHTDSSNVANLVNEKEVQDLPVNGRNFYRLVQLVPGATEGPSNSMLSGNRPDDRRVTSAVSINGAPENLNNQMIDGIDNNERGIGTVTVKPSMDAIAEVRVQTNLYSADTGRTAGGIINVLTKSGTNQFHGSAYDFERNDRFDSRDYFATTDPVLKQHQVGGSIGGPIISNKTFFFADYENFRNKRGLVQNLTLPTAKMRVGDFSEVLPAQIFDPTTNPRVPFDGNIIPANRLDPIVQKYMSLLPANTNAGLANNYQATVIGTMKTHTADGRVDHRFNAGNSLFARFSMNNASVLQPGGCDPVSSGPYAGISAVCRSGDNNFPGTNHTTAQGYQSNFVRVFNPTLIGEFKGGYMHLNLNTYPYNYLSNISTKFGLPNVDLDDIANGGGLATVTINGFTALGDGTFMPLLSHGNTQQYSATITKSMGSHSVKIGGGAVIREWGVIKSSSPLGTWTFSPNETRSTANVGGNGMASFILGYPATVTRQHYPFRPSIHSNEPNVYLQDDWRTTSWLTVNLGFRYEVFTPYWDTNNNLSNMQILDVATPVVLVAGKTSNRNVGIKTDYGDYQPRLGFAATLPHSYVLRGGYGITFFPGNIASPYDMKNPPITPSYGPITSAADTGGAPDVFFDTGLPVFDYNASKTMSIALTDLTGSFAAVDVNFKSTRMQQFNLQMEKELKGNVVTVGYIGARGDHVTATSAIDRAPVGPGTVQPRRRYFSVLPGLTSINVAQSILNNWYDAVQFQFQRRFSKGLSFNTHLRISKGTNESQSGWDYTVIEKSLTGQDVHHAFVFQANYALPFASGTKGIVHGVAAGWQVNAVANWQGGTPFGISNSTARANTGGSDRPNKVGDPVLPKNERTVQRWFNTAADVAQDNFTLGNAPPDIMHGPVQRRLDLSFFKDLKVHANQTIQLRYEVYNVMNAVNFQNPSGSLGNAAYGTLSSTGNANPRQMQFAVKFSF